MPKHCFYCLATTFFLLCCITQTVTAQPETRVAPSVEDIKKRKVTLEKELVTASTDTARARLNMQLSTMWVREDENRALSYAEAGLNMAKKSGDTETMARSYFGNGNICFRLNRFDQALEHLKTGLAYAQELDQPELLSTYFQMTAQVYQRRGMYEKAFELYHQSVAQMQKMPNIPEHRLSTLNLQIGNILDRTGKTRESIGYFEKSATISEKLEDWEKAGGTWNNIAQAWHKLGEEQRANEAFAKAGELMEKTKKKPITRPLSRLNDN